MKFLDTCILGAVGILALCLRKKVRRDVEVIIAVPNGPNIEANWFPTAAGLRSEMWH